MRFLQQQYWWRDVHVMATAPPADPSPVTEQKPSCNCPDLSTIQKVDIDKDGTYKYVAFTVCDPKIRTGAIPVVIVRGYKRFIDFEEIIAEVTRVMIISDINYKIMIFCSRYCTYLTKTTAYWKWLLKK